MTDEFPEISIWKNLSGTSSPSSSWGWVGSIATHTSLNFEPHYNEAGTWDLEMPYDDSALPVRTDRLYTIDWRGHRTTWALDSLNPKQDDKGQLTLQMGGPSALSMIGREVAWPDPSKTIPNQPALPLETPVLYTGTAEDVVHNLVLANFIGRNSGVMQIATNQHRGLASRARGRWNNLLELIAKKANVGGVGIDVNLVNTSDTRAELTFQVYEPVDRSGRVSLSQDSGTVTEWSQNNTAPTVTRAIVKGAGDLYADVTTPESIAAATAWGGHRVAFVSGPSSYDNADLVQAGEEALKEGAAVTNVALSGTDSEGLSAFTHYNVGDKVTGQLLTGLDVVDTITSIKVSVTDGAPQIVATFGDPSADDPVLSMAQLVQSLHRRIRQLEQGS